MKKLTQLFALMFVVLAPNLVQAGHDSPLYRAACQYRDAVVDFERHVIRAGYIERHDVRLVDDLEDATSVLRSAARDPYRGHRFQHAYDDINGLHQRVEAAIFGRPCYRPDPAMVRCWHQVTRAYACLVREANACLSGHIHGGAVIQQDIYVPQVTIPQVTVPHSTYPRVTLPPQPVIVPEVRVPRVTVPEVVLPRTSVQIQRSRSRTIDRPAIGYSRDVHVDRYRSSGFGYAQPTYHRIDNHDVGAAIVGALLTRMLN